MENTDNICKLVLLIVCVGELRGEVRWNKSVLKKEIPTERFLSWCVWDHQFSCNFIHVILRTPPPQPPPRRRAARKLWQLGESKLKSREKIDQGDVMGNCGCF